MIIPLYCPSKSFHETESPFFDAGVFPVEKKVGIFVHSMVLKFFPKTDHLRQGQTVWATVHKDEKGSYGKQIKDTSLPPVVLTLVQDCDALESAHGKRLRAIKKEATARCAGKRSSRMAALPKPRLQSC